MNLVSIRITGKVVHVVQRLCGCVHIVYYLGKVTFGYANYVTENV